MGRRGNCGFAPPRADEARPQFPQPRRFAGRGFMPRPGNGKCGKVEARAATRPARRRASPHGRTTVRPSGERAATVGPAAGNDGRGKPLPYERERDVEGAVPYEGNAAGD